MTPTPEQIEAWARASGFATNSATSLDAIDGRFAKLAALAYAAGAAAEREACAKVCGNLATYVHPMALQGQQTNGNYRWGQQTAAESQMTLSCAERIRARKP